MQASVICHGPLKGTPVAHLLPSSLSRSRPNLAGTRMELALSKAGYVGIFLLAHRKRRRSDQRDHHFHIEKREELSAIAACCRCSVFSGFGHLLTPRAFPHADAISSFGGSEPYTCKGSPATCGFVRFNFCLHDLFGVWV